MSGESGTRGVKTKLLGFILMVLGTLDCLLTLRAGIPAYKFLLLIFVGACVFTIGAIRAARKPARRASGTG